MSPPRLGLLLGCGLGLCCLLLVAIDHDDAYEGTHHGGAQKSEDNRDANGPDAWREDVVERMAGINKGLL